MTGGASIENDRVDLYNIWKFFRARLQRQQGGHRTGVRQSLLPLLVELAEEVLRGFDAVELHAAWQEVGKLGLWVKRHNVGMKGFVQLAGEAATLDEALAGNAGPARLPEEMPVQPVFRESSGALRFVANEFVRWMLDEGTRQGVFSLNTLATLDYPADHFAQLLQLIGYSVGGFETNDSVPDHSWQRVAAELRRQGLRDGELPGETAEGA